MTLDLESPQLSVPLLVVPQSLPRREQKAALVSAIQPQTLGTPPPAHVSPVAEQEPQLAVRESPQLSELENEPQSFPCLEQNVELLSAVHPQTLVVPLPPQVSPNPLQLPQLVDRLSPQLSAALTVLQSLPSRVQKALLASGVHPQTFAAPEPPQDSPVPLQAPQFVVREVPQLSLAVREPQSLPCRLQNVALFSGVHPQTLGTEFPQLSPVPVQVPQLMVPRFEHRPLTLILLQSFPRIPQVAAALGQPQTLAVPPSPQPSGLVQEPQLAVRAAPQLSFAVREPQFFPSREQKSPSASGVHPHWFSVPAPPQLSPVPVHVPQFTRRTNPQVSVAS